MKNLDWWFLFGLICGYLQAVMIWLLIMIRKNK